MWANNSAGNFMWSSLPSDNPTGATPQTLTHGFTFSSTGAGTCPAASANNGPLPVSLTKFDAQEMENEIYLDWSTATEQDNDFFAIEKSSDARTFVPIGEVKGSGTSFERKEYRFTDSQPYPGINYYRLKQVDFDGNFSYSDIISVRFDQKKKRSVCFRTQQEM